MIIEINGYKIIELNKFAYFYLDDVSTINKCEIIIFLYFHIWPMIIIRIYVLALKSCPTHYFFS